MSETLDHPEASSQPGSDAPSPETRAADHSRRVFLFKLSVMLNAAVGAVLAVPLVGYLLGPALKKGADTGSWIAIGSVDDFPVGETRLADFRSPVASFDDGDTAKVACWVRRISDRTFQVFAINCAHLGCPVRWFAQSKLFMCPCHGGAYYQDGSRASGPPERGLFEYRYKLAGDSLVIHAGDMPTLATQASCKERPLVQIGPSVAETVSTAKRSTPWQA
jgi:Rieske Fe-S protein